jgi:hypothetical protein
MEIINGKIVLGTKSCHWCGDTKHPGLMASRKTCPKCKGTKRGPRGGRGGCRDCDHNGQVYDHENLITCGACNGTKIVPENICDTITAAQWQSMEFKVIRDENGRFGFNESYLGLGYVSTCVDYGTAWGRNNADELIEKVKADSNFIQATKIAKNDLTVCKYIAILVSKSGYKIKAVFDGDDPTDNSQADMQVRQLFDPRKLAVAELHVAMEQRT